MKPIISAVLFFILFNTSLSSIAQDSSSKTLLWRISGNGLQKPSYLYGTMHLKDRRLFFFGDSVYKSIESSAGFAMEIDPNEMMDSIFSKLQEADTSSLLRKILGERKFRSVAKKLEKKFGMPAEKISRKQLITERENWYYHINKPDDMKTSVDMYLYDIARKQGKWVGGIEDVNDQLGIKDELGKDINIAEYVDDDNDIKRKAYLNRMINIYTTGDIKKMDEEITGAQSQKSKDLLLVNRNIKMAKRMDSLGHVRNSFFAVGAAHLPGETGLIQLLRSKGFNVSPVFSSVRLAPEKYTYTVHEIPWIKFSQEDSAYKVEMPGKPADLKLSTEQVKLKVYADLVTNTVYMTAFSFMSLDESPDSAMDRMVRSFFIKGFEKPEEKKINNKGINGRELITIRENIYYRMQVFAIENKIFMVLAGGEQKKSLFSAEVERFLLSFTMNTSLKPKPNNWVNYVDTLKAFAVSFPNKPSVDKLKPAETEQNFESTNYSAMDLANATYYLVGVSDTKRGFIITDDSLIFNGKLNYYKQIKAVLSDTRKFTYEGNAAVSFSAGFNKDGLDLVARVLIICRGNRSYYIVTVTQKGKEDYPDISRFFRSFTLTPYKQAVWGVQESANKVFSTWAPASFAANEMDTSGLTGEELQTKLNESSKLVQLIAHEPYSTTSYTVTGYPASKYYAAKSDSSFFEEQARGYFYDTSSNFAKENAGHFDSLIYKKLVINGGVKGMELLVKNASKSYFKRIRIFAHGDSSYHLVVLAPQAVITNADNNHFFEAFRFGNESLPSSIFKNKTSVILADLGSADSATKKAAREAMENAKFEVADLALLYEAYLKKYPTDSTEYTTVHKLISNAVNALGDSSTVSFVRDNYITATLISPELKPDMLGMLAEQQSRAAVTVLKELLLTAPPTAGNSNAFINRLSDSSLLSAMLFPEAARFFGDSLLGPGMICLASELIDSNMLQKQILSDNVQGVLHTAASQLAQLKKDKDDYPSYNYYVIDVLKKLNSTQSISLLNAFTKMADLEVKKNSLLALFKINQPVSPLEVRKLAADKEYRIYFYKALHEIGKEQLFPAEFATQQGMAEGYVYNNLSDDETSDIACKLLGERIDIIQGVPRRFYLFKVSYIYKEVPGSNLAICGRFDLSRKKIQLQDEELKIKVFYDEKFTLAAVNKLYGQFIADEKNKDILPVDSK